EPAVPRKSGLSRGGRLPGGRARALSGTAYAVAFIVTAAAIWRVAIAPGATVGGDARSAASQAVLFILLANLVLIFGLAFVIGGRVLRLFRNRYNPGARLHLRFVTLFSVVSVVPAVLIALVFGVLLTRAAARG